MSTRAKLVKRCYLFAGAPERLACSVETLAHHWNLQELWLESSALVGRAPESSPWFVRRRGVIIDVPEGAVAGSRAIVSLPDDVSARQATVTIAFPPGLSTGQELTVALEV